MNKLVKGSIAAGVVAVGIGACASAAGNTTPSAIGAKPVSTQPAPTFSAHPAPSPAGTYTGSCDYTIGDDPVDGTSVAIGEVDIVNTGNIGTVDTVTITWPQEASAPLTKTATVKVGVGVTDPVGFHLPMSYNQITLLQSYQSNHGFEDGCTYKVTITDTFGS
jgi:hypothetical protein